VQRLALPVVVVEPSFHGVPHLVMRGAHQCTQELTHQYAAPLALDDDAGDVPGINGQDVFGIRPLACRNKKCKDVI
jgi:hypothetical protein